MNRLHMRRIVSVGAVESGDNPESQILLYKSKAHVEQPLPSLSPAGALRLLTAAARRIMQSMPGITREDAEAEARRRNPAWAEIANPVEKGLDAYITARRSRLERIAATSDRAAVIAKTIRDERQKMTQAETPTEIVARLAADRVAAARASGDPDYTITQARADIWRARPDLVAKSREAPAPSPQPIETISDRVRQVVEDTTRRAAWRPLLENLHERSRDQILAKVRADVWRTPEGEALRDLDRAHGQSPYTPTAVSEIRKSENGSRFDRALGVLDEGIAR